MTFHSPVRRFSARCARHGVVEGEIADAVDAGQLAAQTLEIADVVLERRRGQLDVQAAGGRVELEVAEELAEILRRQRLPVRDRAVLAGQDRAGVPHLRLDRARAPRRRR